MSSPILSDAEIDEICAGLTQGAAKVRFLRRLGVPVERKPNGRPLVRRVDWERRNGASPTEGEPEGINWRVAR